MKQVAQSFSWSSDGLYFKLCSNYLYLLLFRCSLFHENPRCEPMLTETTIYKNLHKISQQKGFIKPFTASINPVNESLHNFNTNSVLFTVFPRSKAFRKSRALCRSYFHGVYPC